MAAIPAPEQQADSPVAVLAAIREARAAADREEVRVLELAADWAAMHEIDLSSPLLFEQPARFTGKGVPEIGEFCVPELAAALHISTEAAGSLIADALELTHRLPRVWARVKAGKLAPWRARRIGGRTTFLPPEGAEYVDRHVARFAHKVGIAQLDRLVEEALVRFDPDQAEQRRLSAADNRHVTIYTDQTDFTGTAHVDADLDLADALDLDAALSEGAARLADLGCEDSLDVRRAHALGELARGTDPTLPLPGREVVLNVHVSDDAITGDDAGADGTRLARLENTRSFVSVDQVRTWCGTPGTTITVKPVIDLNEHLSGTAYETPDRLVEQSALVARPASSRGAPARPAAPTATTSFLMPRVVLRARATSPGSAGGTTASRPTRPGTTWCSSAAATCGPARTATSSSATARERWTSRPRTRAAGQPSTATSISSRTRSLPAPHPAIGGVSGMPVTGSPALPPIATPARAPRTSRRAASP